MTKECCDPGEKDRQQIGFVQREWIEVVFGVDPDNRTRALEWLIVGALFVVTITLFTLARYEWRRAQLAR